MFKKDLPNSVFPPVENKNQEFIEPLKLASVYNPKVLCNDWQSLVLAEPRNNTNFRPPNGNLHTSSYWRLGSEKTETWITETQEKLEEINSKDDYITIFPQRSTLNMFSHNLTEDSRRKDELRSAGFELYPDNYGCTDYRTTSQIEYPLHFPMKPRPHSSENKPWLIYRRTLSYKDEELSQRDCNEKFFDEGMEIHNKIAVLKMDRYRSYNPISKEFTEPCRLAVYK